MTLLNFVGFETGQIGADGGQWEEYSRVGATTTSIDSSIKRTGGYSAKVNPTTTAVGYYEIAQYAATGERGLFNSATLWYQFYIYITTLPASNSEELMSAHDISNFYKFALRVNSTGKLMAFASDGTTQLGIDGATTISTTTWYKIGVKVGTGASAAYEVKINDSSELSGTGNLGTSNNARLTIGKRTNRNGNSVVYNYDDVAIDNADYPTTAQCKAMLVNADGALTVWTIGAGSGDKWQQVDDLPNDGDTSYLLSTVVIGEAYTAALQSTAAAGISGTILAVKACGVFKRNTTTSEVDLRFRSATTNSDAPNYNAGASYAAIFKLFTTDPATSAAWLLPALDSIEVGGVSSNTSYQIRGTMFCALVWYIPAGARNYGFIF